MTLLRRYGFALIVVGLCTVICLALPSFFERTNLVMVYLLGVLIVALRGSRDAAALASVTSVLCFDFFFVPPRFRLVVSDAQYAVTFIVFFATAMTISHLTLRLRREAELAREGERVAAMIHAFTQQLLNLEGRSDVIRTAEKTMARFFHTDVHVFVPDAQNPVTLTPSENQPSPASEKELAVAQWVYDRGEVAGIGTATLPDADGLYVPIRGSTQRAGVLRLRPRHLKTSMEDQRALIDSFCNQLGLALEADRFQKSAQSAQVEVETERMRNALLSSVSHDFRTPLTAIVGSASTLLARAEFRENSQSRDLLENIQGEAERLSRLVRNLLEATQLESGAVRIQKERIPLEEVVGTALERVEKSLGDRRVSVDIPEDLPLIPMDALLIEQVFINLLENAARHTPAGRSIGIQASLQATEVNVSVSDEGSGIPPEHLERVFEKFYHDAASPGAGLGLAICRGIVQAHGGRIWAQKNSRGGAEFCFTLPCNP